MTWWILVDRCTGERVSLGAWFATRAEAEKAIEYALSEEGWRGPGEYALARWLAAYPAPDRREAP